MKDEHNIRSRPDLVATILRINTQEVGKVSKHRHTHRHYLTLQLEDNSLVEYCLFGYSDLALIPHLRGSKEKRWSLLEPGKRIRFTPHQLTSRRGGCFNVMSYSDVELL